MLDKLNAAVQAFVTSPAERANQAARNSQPLVGDRAQFGAFVEGETARLGKMAKELKIVAE